MFASYNIAENDWVDRLGFLFKFFFNIIFLEL